MDSKPASPPSAVKNTSLAIPPSDYPDVHALVSQIQDEMRRASTPPSERPFASPSIERAEFTPAAIIRTMTTIATNVWKLRVKMTDPDSDGVKEEFKRLYRHVESIVESLADIGIEIKDRTGEIFDYGLPEKVIATQSKAGISKKLVIETVKPTI